MDQIKFIVSFAGYESISYGYRRRRVKLPATLYIEKVSYGKHTLLSKWWNTKDKSAAQSFSKVMAEDIQQFLIKQRHVDVKVEQVILSAVEA